MNYLKNILLIMLISAFTFNTQAQADFADWDTDNDMLLEKREFVNKFIDEYYSIWSEDAQTVGIIEDDFFRTSYANLDTDNDRMLTDEEWLIGYNYYYDDYLVNEEIGLIDTNDNGRIEYDEYYNVIYETNYFTDIDLDQDNYISEYELAEYIFENWDTDNDGLIGTFEFKAFENYYLDV